MPPLNPVTISRESKITFGLLGALLATAVAGGIKFGALGGQIDVMIASTTRIETVVEKIDGRLQTATVEIVELRANQRALQAEVKVLRAELELVKSRSPR